VRAGKSPGRAPNGESHTASRDNLPAPSAYIPRIIREVSCVRGSPWAVLQTVNPPQLAETSSCTKCLHSTDHILSPNSLLFLKLVLLIDMCTMWM
jgi:hypothetical protein